MKSLSDRHKKHATQNLIDIFLKNEDMCLYYIVVVKSKIEL